MPKKNGSSLGIGFLRLNVRRRRELAARVAERQEFQKERNEPEIEISPPAKNIPVLFKKRKVLEKGP